MFNVKLRCQEKHGYIDVKNYEIPYPFNQIKQNKNPDKKIYYSLENYSVKNIKGNFYIYYAKKIDLNNKNFATGTRKVKVDGGWITNTSAPTTVKYDVQFNIHSFNPILSEYPNAKTIPLPKSDDNLLSTDILGISQYIILQKKILFYLSGDPNNIISTAKNDKFSFPLYLIRSHNDVRSNFQFFMEYENKTLGKFVDEEVTLRIKLYDEDEVK